MAEDEQLTSADSQINLDSGRLKVGLVQINNSFSGQNYLPLSAGMLQAYAQKYLTNPQRYKFLIPIYSRIRIKEAVQHLIQSNIVGFSTYVWNFQISLAIAKELNRQKPEIVIVFGGPHVPDRIEGFLRKYPFIDIVCHGEGEQVFTSILENINNWDLIPSISYLDKDDKLMQNPRMKRINDLSIVPSPYLENTFKSLIRENPNEHWIAMWETNRGCPFSCAFCDWGSATSAKVNRVNIERLYEEIEWFAEHRIEYVFCTDANFGILPRDLDIARYLAETKQRKNYPQAISIQATKNAQERSYKVQKILADAGMNKAVVLSMQSLHEPTLKAIKRDNISLDSFKELQIRFAAQGIETMTDLILAQPEETYKSWINGVDTLLNLGQHNRIQFNNLSILPNAEMGVPEYQRKYGMTTVTSKVVNVHGKLPTSNEIIEMQELVIATNTMPKKDWVRTRAFSWMVGLLHFNKILQIPIIVLHTSSSFIISAGW